MNWQRALTGIGAFVGGVVFLSAVLSPLLYAMWEALPFGDDPFRRVFNRTLMIAAVALLVPLIRWWKITSWEQVGLGPRRDLIRDWSCGFGLGLLLLFVLVMTYLAAGVRTFPDAVAPGRVGSFLLSGFFVGIVEETLFRGVFFLALLRARITSLPILVVATSLFFAVTHFLKAPDLEGSVTWLSGWQTWGAMLTGPEVGEDWLRRGWTLFLFGTLLCVVTWRMETLWTAMGLHAGCVFGLKLSHEITNSVAGTTNLWFTADIMSGFATNILLVLAAGSLIIPWRGRRNF